jgi:DNA mismatch repair ATPase MutL
MKTIEIQGRTFTIEKQDNDYHLKGVRGAHYRTIRNAHRQNLMFLVNARGIIAKAPEVWLTDKWGKLQVTEVV